MDTVRSAARTTGRSRRFAGPPRTRALAVLVVAAASVLSACGSSTPAASSSDAPSAAGSATAASSAGAAPAVTTVEYQLSWTKDYEWGGSFLADDRGYYKDAGITVDMISGGGSSSPVQAVASGQALVASASLDEAAQLTADGGADLAIIGATFQKNGLNILSRADNPIRTPQDLVGKRIGVFASNDPQWSLFLELNGIDKSSITEVPVQYDVTPLVTGDVDGYQGYAGGELTTLKAQGVDPQVMLFADNGYNPVSAGYVVRRESLDDPAQRAALKAFLEGEIRGWQDVVDGDGVAEGAKLAVEKYGKDLGLDPATQEASLQALIGYVATPYTEENGLLRISPASLESSQKVLDGSDIDVKIVDLVDNGLLDEIYAGKNRLD